jgi:hypothetical protein
MLGSQDYSCGGGVCCGNVVSGLTAAGLQRLRRLCWRWPLKELQWSVGDDNADWRLRRRWRRCRRRGWRRRWSQRRWRWHWRKHLRWLCRRLGQYLLVFFCVVVAG